MRHHTELQIPCIWLYLLLLLLCLDSRCASLTIQLPCCSMPPAAGLLWRLRSAQRSCTPPQQHAESLNAPDPQYPAICHETS